MFIYKVSTPCISILALTLHYVKYILQKIKFFYFIKTARKQSGIKVGFYMVLSARIGAAHWLLFISAIKVL